jgi:hypothetical protein
LERLFTEPLDGRCEVLSVRFATVVPEIAHLPS